MRDLLSRHKRSLRLLCFTAIIILAVSIWKPEIIGAIYSLVVGCLLIPMIQMGFIVWLSFQFASRVVNKTAHRKQHVAHEWGSVSEQLKHDSHYSIGDDGELIEFLDTDEKQKRDDS
jgi:hypothetical protein